MDFCVVDRNGREVRGVGVDDDLSVLDGDRVGLDAGAGIDEAAAGGDLELPEMPRAADDFALAREVMDKELQEYAL